MATYRFPSKLIGKTIIVNESGSKPGSAYDPSRRRHTAVVVDGGRMTAESPGEWLLLDDGTMFHTDQFDDWKVAA